MKRFVSPLPWLAASMAAATAFAEAPDDAELGVTMAVIEDEEVASEREVVHEIELPRVIEGPRSDARAREARERAGVADEARQQGKGLDDRPAERDRHRGDIHGR